MRKKKLVAILAASALAVSMFAGCGSSSDSADASSAEATEAAEETEAEETEADDAEAADETADAEDTESSGSYKMALIKQHNSNNFQSQITDTATAYAEEKGIDLTVLSSEQDAATQISQIEQCTAEGYDVIMFEPVDPDGLQDAAKEAADAGVIVINVISALNDWEDYGVSCISLGDDERAGTVEMEKVAELLDGKGNIAILTGPSGDSGGLNRLKGYESVLENYPDIVQVVEPTDCSWDTAEAQATVESWLSAYDLDAIVCEDDGMALGAGNAAGEGTDIIITGIGGNSESFEAIEDGRMTGSVSQSGGDMVKLAMDAAMTLCDGGELDETTIYVPNEWMDINNLDDFR